MNLRALLAAALVCLPFAAGAQVVPSAPCQGKACSQKVDAPLETSCPNRSDGKCTTQDILEDHETRIDAGGGGGGGADKLGPDGDVGDATVSGTGTSLTINTNAVTTGKVLDGTLTGADVSDGSLDAADTNDTIRKDTQNFDYRVKASSSPTNTGGCSTSSIDGCDIQAVINDCPASPSPRSVGCTIVLPGGIIPVPATITVGNNTTNGDRVAVTLIGQGPGYPSISGSPNGRPGAAGTILQWAGGGGEASGSAVLEIRGATYFSARDFGITLNGDAAGDGSGYALTTDDASVGIRFTADNSASATSQWADLTRIPIHGNRATPHTNLASACIDITGATNNDQVDKMSMRQVATRYCAHGLRDDSDQAVAITAFNSSFQGQTNGIDALRGGITLSGETFVGCDGTNCTQVEVDRGGASTPSAPAYVRLLNTYHELRTGETLLKVGGGALGTGTGRTQVEFASGRVAFQCTPTPCDQKLIDAVGRGSIRFAGMKLEATGGDPGNQTFSVDVRGASSTPLVLDWSDNWIDERHGGASSVTRGSGATLAYIDAPMVTAAGIGWNDLNLNEKIDDPEDRDGDGSPDYIACGDTDGDGTLEIIDDLQACVNLLTDTGAKELFVYAGTYNLPPLTSCDTIGEPCYTKLTGNPGVAPPTGTGSGGGYALELPANMHMVCAGERETILKAWPYVDSGGISQSAQYGFAMVGARNRDNVHVERCGLEGGAQAAYNSTGFPFGSAQRGFQFTGGSDLLVEHNRVSYFRHASFFHENTTRAKFVHNESQYNSGYNDAGTTSQADFYTFVFGTAGQVTDTVLVDNTVLDSGGTAYHFRNESVTTGGRITGARLRGNRAKSAEASCFDTRGVNDFQEFGTVCELTSGVRVWNASTNAYREAGAGDSSIGVNLNDTIVRNSNPGNNNAAIRIEKYNDGVHLNNILVENADSTVSTGITTGCVKIDAPQRNFELTGTLRRCGTVGTALLFTSTSNDSYVEPDEQGRVNVKIEDADASILDGSRVFGMAWTGTQVMNGWDITAFIRGSTDNPVSIVSASSLAHSKLKLDIDFLQPYYIGAFTFAAKPTCASAYANRWIKITDSGSCTADDASTNARCRCTGSAWEATLGEAAGDGIEVLSAVGLVDNDIDVKMANVPNGDGLDFAGAGTSDHTGNRIKMVCRQDSAGIVTGSPICVDFGDGTSTNNLYDVDVATATPATAVDRGSSNTFSARQRTFSTATPSGSCTPGEEWTDTDGGVGTTRYLCEDGTW